MEADLGGVAYAGTLIVGGFTLDRAYFARAYFRFTDASPATVAYPIGAYTSTTLSAASGSTNGTLTLRSGAAPGTAIGSPSSGLSDNTWYMLSSEIIVPTAGSGTLEARLDGSVFATSAAASVGTTGATGAFRFGNLVASTAGLKVYTDDVAVNDDQGANQNSYPGAGKVILLKPTADSAIGNWVSPQTTGDDTTDLWDNVNNTPPLGVAHLDDDASAGKYVFNIVSGGKSNFTSRCRTTRRRGSRPRTHHALPGARSLVGEHDHGH